MANKDHAEKEREKTLHTILSLQSQKLFYVNFIKLFGQLCEYHKSKDDFNNALNEMKSAMEQYIKSDYSSNDELKPKMVKVKESVLGAKINNEHEANKLLESMSRLVNAMIDHEKGFDYSIANHKKSLIDGSVKPRKSFLHTLLGR